MYGESRCYGSATLSYTGKRLTRNFCNRPIITWSNTSFRSTRRALSTAVHQRSPGVVSRRLTSTLGKIDHSPVVQPNEQRLECDFIEPNDQLKERGDSRFLNLIDDLHVSCVPKEETTQSLPPGQSFVSAAYASNRKRPGRKQRLA
jgi:hypothetical protein